MLKESIAFVIVIALLFPALPVQAQGAQKQTVMDQARRIPAGSPVEVQLQGGTRLRGLLRETTSEGLVLEVTEGGNPETQIVKSKLVKSITQLKSLTHRHSWRKTVIIVGAIFIVLGLVTIPLHGGQ